MTSVRRLEIRVDQTGSAAKGIKSISDSITKVGKVAGAAAVGGLALLAGAVLGIGAKLTSLGADAEEMEAKFDAVFGEGAPEAAKELDEFGNAVGRNKFALMEMASTVQDTFVPLGFARDKAAEMSLELVKLAVDVGSFNNILAPDVLEDFQSALVGETETVRKYGIVINQARIETKAMEMGLIKMHVSTADVEDATLKLEIAQAKHSETMGGSVIDSEKVRAAQVNLGLATEKASIAAQKHTIVLEEHGEGSIKAQESAIRLAAANERVTKAQAKLTDIMTGGEVADSKKLAATQRLIKAKLKLESALRGESGALTETAKAAAIMQIIIENTSDAHGDAEKTSGSWTNQMLAMKEAVAEGATEMGLFLNKALLPLLSAMVPWVIDLMPKAVEIFKKFAENLSDTVEPAMILIEDAIIRIAEVFGVKAEDISETGTVLWLFEGALAAIVSVVPLVASAFQGLADGLEEDVVLWENIKKKVGDAWVILKKIAAISLLVLIEMVEALTGTWDDLLDVLFHVGVISFVALHRAVEGIRHAVGTLTIYWDILKFSVQRVVEISFWPLERAVEGIRHAVGTVTGYWDRMRDAARKAIDIIPDWLRPGSPTPFELGLKGINQAAKDIDLSLGMGGKKGAGVAMAGAGRGGGTTINLNFTYSPAVSLADSYEAQEKLTPFILGALRTAGVAL